MNKLYKSRKDKKIAGVCGGIAEKLGIDSTFIRLIWAISSLYYGSGLMLYILFAIIIPDEPINGQKQTEDNYSEEGIDE